MVNCRSACAGRHARRHGFQRVLVLDGFEAEIAARGHHQRVGQQLRRDRCRPAARAGAGGARRLACRARPHSSTALPSRTAVITSCRALRERTCMCTSPAATRGTPVRRARAPQRVQPQHIVQAQQQFDGQPGARAEPAFGPARSISIASSAPCVEGTTRISHPSSSEKSLASRLTMYSPFFASRLAAVMNSHRLPQPVTSCASATRRKPSNWNSLPRISRKG